MKLCVFQGTFNPIHKVHIELAKFAQKYYHFDKILFIPAYRPPHKSIDSKLAMHRFNMVKLAISERKEFQISDIEYQNERNSYTYYTILELKNKYKISGKINFLIGTDAFKKIDTWYETDKLKDLLHFIVFQRTHDFNQSDFNKFKTMGYEFEFAPMNFIDVSSTELRTNLIEGESIEHIEIPKVREYIEKYGLYQK